MLYREQDRLSKNFPHRTGRKIQESLLRIFRPHRSPYRHGLPKPDKHNSGEEIQTTAQGNMGIYPFTLSRYCNYTKHLIDSLGFQHLPRNLAKVNAWKTMFDPYINYLSCNMQKGFNANANTEDSNLSV